jgi:two-component system LytT family sensor kinase
MFTLRNRYIYILGLGSYSYLNSVFSEVYTHYPIPLEGWIIFLAFLMICALVWEVNRVLYERMGIGNTLKQAPVGLPKTLRGITQHPLFKLFVMGSILSALVTFTLLSISGYFLLDLKNESFWVPMKLALLFSSRINLFLHCLNVIFYFFKQNRVQQIEAESLKRIGAQAELQAIKNQINPHFLFNNLNVLSSLMVQNQADANRFVESFSAVYRYILNNQYRELVTLREEKNFMKPYFFLLEKRFQEGITVQWEVPEEQLNCEIVPVALQMLVENAIKHNIVSKTKPLNIRFSMNSLDTLVVTNNLQPKLSAEPSTKVGLVNISKRYELITGRKVYVENNGEHFKVFLPLIQPTHENSDHRR